MKPEVRFYIIFMYLYNKNILEYAQIAQSEPKSMILNIEGRSISDPNGNKLIDQTHFELLPMSDCQRYNRYCRMPGFTWIWENVA